MNFGTILDSMTKVCVRRIYENDQPESKRLARTFIDFINIKEVLAKQFHVYHNLNTAFVADKVSARIFVTETIDTLSKYTFEDIKVYNALLETKFSVPKMKSSEINHHIANMIMYRTSDGMRDPLKYVQSLDYLTEHVSTVREKPKLDEEAVSLSSTLKFLKPQHVLKIAAKKFNQKYTSMFNEDDRKVFSVLRSGDKTAVEALRRQILEGLDSNSGKVKKYLDEDLSIKLDEAISEIKQNDTRDGILCGHELLSELKELNKDG